jgi:hypothetical protein
MTMNFRTYSEEVLEALNIRKKTLATYRSMYRRHIDEELGTKPIATITRVDVQAVIKPLTPQTSAMTLAVMKTLFREGISRGLIDSSLADGSQFIAVARIWTIGHRRDEISGPEALDLWTQYIKKSK